MAGSTPAQRMQRFSIKDVEIISGIKAHTLRIWEQRYQISLSKRKDSNQRYYDADDLKHLLRLSYLYRSGEKIADISKLSKEELRQLALEKLLSDSPEQQLVIALTDATIEFDETLFEKVLDKTILTFGFERAMLAVVYPFIERVGLLWLTDLITPVQEHFSSNIIRRKMLVAIDQLAAARPGPEDSVYLLFTPEGEYHELPLIFLQYLLRSRGLAVIYAGVSVNQETAWQIAQQRPVTHVWVHGIVGIEGSNAQNYADTLAHLLKTQQLIFSGPLFKEVAAPNAHSHLPASLAEMMDLAKQASAKQCI